MWIERLVRRIRKSDVPILIEDNLYGISEVADSLLTDNGRTLWIEFDSSCLSALRAANWGVPSSQSVPTLGDALWLQKELLHAGAVPIVILTKAENAVDEILHVLGAVNWTHRIVISGSVEALGVLSVQYPSCEFVNKEQLYVTKSEISDKLGHRTSEGTELNHDELTSVNTYEDLCRVAYAQVGTKMPIRRTPRRYSTTSACLTKKETGLVKLLSRNRHWKRALDVALATGSTDLFDVIDFVGEDALMHSELSTFRRKLLALPGYIRDSAEVLYWLLIAEHHLKTQSDLDNRILRFLRENDCPRLRALLSILGRARTANVQDLKVEDASDPVLRIYTAHMQSFGRLNTDSVSRLRRLVDSLRIKGRDYRMVQSMMILANSLVLLGKISEAAHWALEAREVAAELNLSDYFTAITTGPAAYALLVRGEGQSAAELLNQVPQPEKFAGLPFVDGLLSTVADHFAAAGFHKTALRWYEIVPENYSGPSADIVMPDVALMLVRLGKPEQAIARVSARLAELGESEVSHPWLVLAQAIAFLTVDNLASERMLLDLLDSNNELPLLFEIRARLLVALECFKAGMKRRAFKILDPVGPELQQIGDSGWQLLTGADDQVSELQHRWTEYMTPLEIEFLGGSGDWRYRISNSESVPSSRFKELLCVLSFFPGGIRADRLTELLGWGSGGENTVRRHIHRLRSHVPIEARPYRIGVRVEADYVTLLEAIEEGDLSNALLLYAGPLLVDSDSPFIVEQRTTIEEQLRTMVLNRGTAEQVAGFALVLGDDLDLLEYAATLFDSRSKMLTRLQSRISAVKLSWSL